MTNINSLIALKIIFDINNCEIVIKIKKIKIKKIERPERVRESENITTQDE
jgi:hypothetical protein